MYYMKYLVFKNQTVVLYSKTIRFHYAVESEGNKIKIHTDSKNLEFEYDEDFDFELELEGVVNFLGKPICTINSTKTDDYLGVGMIAINANIYDISFGQENIIYQLELLRDEFRIELDMSELHLSYGAAMVFNKMMVETSDMIEVFISRSKAISIERRYGLVREYSSYEQSTIQRIFDIELYADIKTDVVYNVHSRGFSYEDPNTLIDRYCHRNTNTDSEIIKDLFTRYFRVKTNYDKTMSKTQNKEEE